MFSCEKSCSPCPKGAVGLFFTQLKIGDNKNTFLEDGIVFEKFDSL